MNPEQLLMAEASMNIAAGVALAATLFKIRAKASRNLLHTRLTILLINLLLIVTIRGIDYAFGVQEATKIILFCLSAILPLSSILFAEGLMRRHAPLPLKLFGLIGSITLCLASFSYQSYQLYFFAGLSGFQLSVFASIVWIAWHRPVASLSETENRTLVSLGLILLISLPLLISDFRFVFGWNIPRMGALAILLFTVTMLKLTDKPGRRQILLEIAYIPAINLLGASVFSLVWGDSKTFIIVYPMLIAFHLFIVAMNEILFGQGQIQDWIFVLLEKMNSQKKQDLKTVQSVVKEVLNSQTLLIFSEDELASYDLEALKEAMALKEVHSLRELRDQKSDSFSKSQLIYLMESHQMSEIHLISLEPLVIILVNNRSMGFSSDYQKELSLLRNYVTALSRKAL